MKLVEKIIRNSDVSRKLQSGKGLPVGNLTSQFFANVYLDPLDHFIKDHMGIKCYIRYMDDMVILSDTKQELREILRKKETFLTEKLELRLNPKATRLNSRQHGLPFLGYRPNNLAACVLPASTKVCKSIRSRRTPKVYSRLIRSSTEGIPLGILVKSSRPIVF